MIQIEGQWWEPHTKSRSATAQNNSCLSSAGEGGFWWLSENVLLQITEVEHHQLRCPWAHCHTRIWQPVAWGLKARPGSYHSHITSLRIIPQSSCLDLHRPSGDCQQTRTLCHFDGLQGAVTQSSHLSTYSCGEVWKVWWCPSNTTAQAHNVFPFTEILTLKRTDNAANYYYLNHFHQLQAHTNMQIWSLTSLLHTLKKQVNSASFTLKTKL